MSDVMTRHTSDEAPPISGDGLEIIDLLTNADAEAADEDGCRGSGVLRTE
ncbi:MAG TPA: hypothetical protein VEI02_12525 [Planctomycetota bacterium]|nr:hypothetical protein [Planctomycetota bacterium]